MVVRGRVSTGEVLAATDACARYGSKCVLVFGEWDEHWGSPEEIVAVVPARKQFLAITALRTRVLHPGTNAPVMPPVGRIRGRFAGIWISAGNGVFEVPYSSYYDEEEKVVETPELQGSPPPVPPPK